MFHSCLLRFCVVACAARLSVARLPAGGATHEQLQPLTRNRQQHRKTVDGRLCAAAFVQDRQAFTGCTEALRLIACMCGFL